MQRAPVIWPEMLVVQEVRPGGAGSGGAQGGERDSQIRRLLCVHDSGHGDTEVGHGAPEVCCDKPVSSGPFLFEM